jgi:hypothetical protein
MKKLTVMIIQHIICVMFCYILENDKIILSLLGKRPVYDYVKILKNVFLISFRLLFKFSISYTFFHPNCLLSNYRIYRPCIK